MGKVDADRVELVLNSDLSLLRVATSFVESSSLAFGLGEDETLSLTLAVEEIFVQMCKNIPQEDTLRIIVSGKGYQVESEFIFSSHEFDLRAFNMVCMPDRPEVEECSDETGMIIASRMVDSFSLDQAGSKLKLKLVKEKFYPEIDHLQSVVTTPTGSLHIDEASAEQIKELIRLASVYYPRLNLPESFRYPGKVVDMAARGDYSTAVATDAAGVLAAGLIWRWESDQLVTFRGPFILPGVKDPDLSTGLTDFMLEHLARTKAVGVISLWPSEDLPVSLFEKLGSQFFFEDDRKIEIKAYFRHLNEDNGKVVFVNSCILEFVKDRYRSLFLARQVELLVDTGESKVANSVISAKILRISKRVVLRPVIFGLDAARNLRAHVSLLRSEGFRNIFFEMDLGFTNAAMFGPVLLQCSFEPRFLIPLAGRGDTVVFQYIPGGQN